MCWTRPPLTTTSWCAASRPRPIRASSSKTLSTLTGESYEQIDQLSTNLPIVNPASIDENEWVAIALANNPNVLASREAQTAAERDLRARQAGHLPTIDAVASYNENINHVQQLAGGQAFLGDETNTRVYGLQLQMPIYQGGFTQSKVREARARLLQSGELLRNNEWTVSRDIRNLLRAVTTDVIRVQARIKSIKSFESSLEATQTGYEVGHAQHRRRAAGSTAPVRVTVRLRRFSLQLRARSDVVESRRPER